MLACERGSQWQLVLLLLAEAPKLGLWPEMGAFVVAAQAAGSAMLPETATSMLDFMRQHSLEPDEAVYRSMALGLSNGGHVAEAIAIYREARDLEMLRRTHAREPGVLDLHGLSAEVGVVAVRAALLDVLCGLQEPGEQWTLLHDGLVLVVGLGKHSPGFRPVVGPAVESMLRAELDLQPTPVEDVP